MALPDLPQELIAKGGPLTLLAAFVWALLSGRLVPRSHVEDVRADRDARLKELAADRDEWRTAYRAIAEAHRLTDAQLGQVLEGMHTIDSFIRALPKAAGTELP